MYTDDAILNDLEEVIRAHREYRRDRSLTNVLDVWEGKESRIGMRGLLEDLTQNPQMYNLTEGRSEILAELYKLLRYEFGELQAAKLSQNREVTRVTELKIDDFFTAVIKEITSCKLDIQNHYRRPPASSAPPPSSPASSAPPPSSPASSAPPPSSPASSAPPPSSTAPSAPPPSSTAPAPPPPSSPASTPPPPTATA